MDNLKILNDPGQWASLGANLGSGLGSGFANTLGLLAQNKIQSFVDRDKQAKLAKTFQSLGLPPELATLPETVQTAYIKQMLQEPANAQWDQFQQSLLGGGTSGAGISQQPQSPSYTGIPGLQGGAPLGGGSLTPEATMTAVQPGTPNPADLLRGLSPKHKLEGTKLILEQQKQARKEFVSERKIALDETRKYRERVENESEGYHKQLPVLKKINELTDKNDISNPYYIKATKLLGIDFPALFSGDTQQMDKLQLQAASGFKDVFGSKGTQREWEAYVSTFPGAMQSPEGRKQVIHNLVKLAELGVDKKKTMDKSIKQNGGYPPLDLSARVDDAMADKYAAFEKSFLEGHVPFKAGDVLTKSDLSKIPNGRPVMNSKGEKGIIVNGEFKRVR